MRTWEESNRDTTLEGKHWNGTSENRPLLPKPQHCLTCGLQPPSDTCLNNVSVHCVRGCLLPPKQWQTDLAVLNGHCRPPTCCHTLPRRGLETLAHQLLPRRTHCGNMETSCVTIRAKYGLPRLGASFESSGSCLAQSLTSMQHLWSRRHC